MTVVAMILLTLIIYHSYSFYDAFCRSLRLANTSTDRENLINLVLATGQVTAYLVTLLLLFIVSIVL